jgi:hypothetical protein
MPEQSAMKRLQDCFTAVYDVSRDIGVLPDETRREPYLAALAELSDAWRAVDEGPEHDVPSEFADRTASLVARIGDDLFYGTGAADKAIAAFETALSIAPRNTVTLAGIIAAYLQGSVRRPDPRASLCRAPGGHRFQAEAGRGLHP